MWSTKYGRFFAIFAVDGFTGCGEEDGGVDENGGAGSEVQVKKLMIHNLLKLRETEPEYYTDEIIKGIIMVINKSYSYLVFEELF